VIARSADEFIRRFLLPVLPTASTASATMASSTIATDRKNWNAAANSWEWPLPIKPLRRQNRRRTTVTATSNGPAFPSDYARSVTEVG
jgi:hypothetical protein